MKTVTGDIVSSTPVSISKAASILSKFVSAETGASQAVSAYLRRASAAFGELVRLHSKPNHRKHKKHKSDASTTITTTLATPAKEIPSQSMEVSRGPSHGVETGKKEKKSDFEDDMNHGRSILEVKKEEESQGDGNVGEETDKKKKKKNKKEKEESDEIEEEQNHGEGNPEEESERKRHKKEEKNVGNSGENGAELNAEEKKVDGFVKYEEDGGKMEIGKEKNEDRKKRKRIQVKEENRDDVEEEQSNKKKKKRKKRKLID